MLPVSLGSARRIVVEPVGSCNRSDVQVVEGPSQVRVPQSPRPDRHDEWQATDRRYLSGDSMSLPYPQRDSLTTAELSAGN